MEERHLRGLVAAPGGCWSGPPGRPSCINWDQSAELLAPAGPAPVAQHDRFSRLSHVGDDHSVADASATGLLHSQED